MKVDFTRGRGVWLCATGALAALAGLAACAPQAATVQEEKTENVAEVSYMTPAADEFGVVVADSWKEIYPHEFASYEANAQNSPNGEKHDYLELYPALNAMYKGYAFSLGYDEASSHVYTLDSVKETPRTNEKEQLASCISCKTPQFTATVNCEGEEIYKQPFWDVVEQYSEPISCYNCHENDPKSATVTNRFFARALGPADSANVPKESQVCGQCHNEYYFDPETKATTNPYSGLETMTPDAILAYFDERGYKDWVHPGTGAELIKVQHPEFETLYGGDQTYMVKQGMTCASCHMGTKVAEDGTKYTSHEWKSPLENQELMDSTCNTSGCHEGDEGGVAGKVAAIQQDEEARVVAISEKIEDMIAQVTEQREAGTLDADELARVQRLHREAQFYWDFVMVENSEGAHNPTLTNETLDKAEAAVDEALALLA